ncbi:hypothetical protein GCM10027566_03110 [Arachidicoccus ginsenosidivorans]|uniref:histidine kinase n=1 Tax=Arachidicoccus ginsenosidivorans TaxID=496057 RepID=A0A5B8VLR2_9BACT|nr:HAMP domain-containing sensor histidine kinase [Arachidicoccus ginsenosidivorans]QEC72467.1 HAMP domain-containing histidine kinase [Arachidicoccus ginsenosidivorans]
MKLLHYTSLRHLLFASLLTLISIPVFYVLLNNIFVHSIDRDLGLQAAQIPSIVSTIQTPADFKLWKELDNDLDIQPADSVTFHDKPFTIQKSPSGQAAEEDFRILQKKIEILGRPYIVNIESSLFEKEDLIQTILTIQLGILVLLLAGTVGINYFIHKRIWKPFYDSLAYLKAFNIESNLAAPQELKRLPISEFTELNQSIQQLSIRVRRAYDSQKEFIENASHELQTPLTVLKFKLELLVQQKDLSQDQGELIGDMYREIEQMQELNRHLLLLSKIENGQFASQETVHVQQVMGEVTEDLSLLAEAKDQEIVKESPPEIVQLSGANRTLFKIMVANLLTNAIQYSPPGSRITIQITGRYLLMSNPGEPFWDVRDSIFKRFVRHNQQKGNGLGLSIVQTIAKYLHYDIIYDYSNGCHQFKIKWPLLG